MNMKEEKEIIETLESIQPKLTSEERIRVWNVVESKLPQKAPIKSPYSIRSPYLFSSLMKYSMTPLIIALILIVGGGGTALASDASRPGDFLFPLERSLENIQLRLALSESGKKNLSHKFTEERLQELREIIDEELVVSSSNMSDDSGTASSTASASSSALEIEADVFTDMTIVKLEINNKKFYFEADTVTREGVVAEIKTRFPMLTDEQINAQLDFQVEERVSRPKDRGVVSLKENGEDRINRAVEEILSFLDDAGLDDVNRDNLLLTLSSEVEGVTKVRRSDDRVQIGAGDSRFEIRVDDNGDSRVEIRDGASRIRIEEKDGEIRVKTKDDSRDDESEDIVRTTLGATPVGVSFEVEADVFTDTTIVKIELDDEEFVFETNSDTRSEVVADIQARFPALTTVQIESRLDFEIEDRVSRLQDGGTRVDVDDEDEDDEEDRDDDRDDEEDDEDDDRGGDRDEEEDEDDNSSGHGNGGDDDEDDD